MEVPLAVAEGTDVPILEPSTAEQSEQHMNDEIVSRTVPYAMEMEGVVAHAPAGEKKKGHVKKYLGKRRFRKITMQLCSLLLTMPADSPGIQCRRP